VRRGGLGGVVVVTPGAAVGVKGAVVAVVATIIKATPVTREHAGSSGLVITTQPRLRKIKIK